MTNLDTENYRVLRHPEFEGLRGEYELQRLNERGDFENVAFSRDQTDFFRLMQD